MEAIWPLSTWYLDLKIILPDVGGLCLIAAGKRISSRGQCPPPSGPSSVPSKPEVEGLGKLRPITSGSEVSDDEENDLLNPNMPRSDLKRVKRYTITN